MSSIISVKNVWSIKEKFNLSSAIAKDYKFETNGARITTTLEELLWTVFQGYGYDLKGMVVRRGSLHFQTIRAHVKEMYDFVHDLIRELAKALGGSEKFAEYVASDKPTMRQPYLSSNPEILAGPGKFSIDTNHFTEQEYNEFMNRNGIKFKGTEDTNFKVDLSRPPKAVYHTPGREPVEKDPAKLREGAADIWKKFLQREQVTPIPSATPTASPQSNRTSTTTSQSTQEQTTAIRDTVEITVRDMQTESNERVKTLEDTMSELTESNKTLEDTTKLLQESLQATNEKIDGAVGEIKDLIQQLATKLVQTNHTVNIMSKTLAHNNNTANLQSNEIITLSDDVQMEVEETTASKKRTLPDQHDSVQYDAQLEVSAQGEVEDLAGDR